MITLLRNTLLLLSLFIMPLGNLQALGNLGSCFGSSGQSCPRDCGKKKDTCCGGMGGISYCDSSAGRYVCQNGDYSVCYCTRHAVMDLQFIQGCCIWQGGVRTVTALGKVICRDGTEAEICSLQTKMNPSSSF